jgi:hypothetical protein
MLAILLPLFLSTSTPCYKVDTVYNYTPIETIGDRNVIFGVKETAEEIASDNGFQLCENADKNISIEILKIESPEQTLNIVGMQWLKKDYIVTIAITVNGMTYQGEAKKSTFLFAALLNVEDNKIPLNKKVFSKTLESALKSTFKRI